MELDTPDSRRQQAFLAFVSCVPVFGLLTYLLAIGGSVTRGTVVAVSVPVLAWSCFSAIRWLRHETPAARIAFLVSIVLPFTLLFSVEPALLSGRDQGSIAEAAMELARHGTLRFSSPAVETFFDLYGPGAALNFPGFHYTQQGTLTSQFPIASISFLGSFAALFGSDGLLIGNGILLGISLLTLFMLVRSLSDEWYASGAFLAGSFSFLPLWFAKYSLSENLFLCLFLILSVSLIGFLRQPKAAAFFLSLTSAILLSATRIEGLFSLLVTCLLLSLSPAGLRFSRHDPLRYRIMPGILISSALLMNAATSVPLYKSVAKALLKDGADGSGGPITDFQAAFELWHLFVPYGLLIPFGLGIVGLLVIIRFRHHVALIPAALALPAFLFLLDPTITPDHPWMLRRFLFSLWPTFYATFPVAVFLFLTKSGIRMPQNVRMAVSVSVFAAIVLASLPVSLRTIPFFEYGGLIGQTAELAGRIGDRDLLLIDREATGDPFAIPAGPLRFLYDRNAVYFFNPADYERIDRTTYDHVYLLTDPSVLSRFGGMRATLSPIESVPFVFSRLQRLPIDEPRIPDRETISHSAFLFELTPL